MARLPSWLIVAAVGILLALAAADAIRPHAEPRQHSGTTVRAPDLSGVLLVAGPGCSVRALRVPTLEEVQAPRQIDCRGIVWSTDGSLSAHCHNGVTNVFQRQIGDVLRLRGCAPAWRPDGALSVVRDGDLVVARRRGPAQVFLTREELAEALAGRLEGGRTYRLVEVAWHGTVAFFGIVAGTEPWQRAVVVYTPEGLTDVIPELGQRISSLRASPLGNVAFAHNQPGREFVMITPAGRELPLPRITNARAIAWSPDERWVALATRTTTFIARSGTRQVILRIPVGGDSLEWLP
jgi:hypothetical protein